MLLAASVAAAQPGPPQFVAPAGLDRRVPSAAEPAVDAERLGRRALELYAQVCAQPQLEPAALVDRALAAGLAPYAGDGGQGADSLLGGRAGQVFAPPADAAQLQLALDEAGRCTVWVQQAEGPKLRGAFLGLIETLRATRGATLTPTAERFVERAGWRQQTGYLWRDAQGLRQLDAVTLLSTRPGLQVLSSAPLAADAAVAPR